MSFLSAIFNPSRLFSIGLGVMTGGMSLYAQLARELVTALGQELIQRLGTRLGLPQFLIDGATNAFTAQMGDPPGARRPIDSAAQAFAQVGYTPQQVGDVMRESNDTINNLINQALTQAPAGDDEDFRAGRGGGGQNFLLAMAIALGKALDKRLTRMFDLSQQMGGLGEISAKNQSKFGELSGELQGQAQLANMLSNALKNAIESVGQAGTTLARRG